MHSMLNDGIEQLVPRSYLAYPLMENSKNYLQWKMARTNCVLDDTFVTKETTAIAATHIFIENLVASFVTQ